MRIVKIILSVIFSIAFLLSIALNVVLGLSSSNSLMFKDSAQARKQLVYTSVSYLTHNNEITITYDYADADDSNLKKRLTISCFTKELNKDPSCTMISSSYSEDYSTDNLVSTTYYPGDGHMYVLEGTSKTKSDYSNSQLITDYNTMLVTSSFYLYDLSQSEISNEDESREYTTKVSFDFNTFSLIKTISLNYKEEKRLVKYTFDGADKISEIADDNLKLSFSYKKTELQFPNFEEYVG